MRTKLLATMKSLISTAKSEGFTRREAMEALAAFCDTIEAAGVPSQLIAECVIETTYWVADNWVVNTERKLDATLN